LQAIPNLNYLYMNKEDKWNLNQAFTTDFGTLEEWYIRNLPHRNTIGLLQSITFRLADSLPKSKLAELESELQRLPKGKHEQTKRQRIERWFDQGYGCCALANPHMAKVMQDALLHHDGERYDLLTWSIMPNHVHVLIQTKEDLPKIIQSWKSFTGKMGTKKQYEISIRDF